MTPPRVLIVDDHELVAQSLAITLGAEGLAVATSGGVTAEEVCTAVLEHQPDLVLLDLDLGDVHGQDLVPWLRERRASVLVVTGTRDRFAIGAAIAAGAAGWVTKSAPFGELVRTVAAAARGAPVLDPRERAMLVESWRAERKARDRLGRRLDRLTAREREVLAALAEGRRAETIAEELVVSLATVRSQIRSILAKLEVNSQLAAVATARRAAR